MSHWNFHEACDILHTLSENFWSLKDLLTKARRLDETSCSETEDVLFETMAVSIFVDCVVIEEACRIGDSVAWDAMVLTAILVLLKEQLLCLRLFSKDIFESDWREKTCKGDFCSNSLSMRPFPQFVDPESKRNTLELGDLGWMRTCLEPAVCKHILFVWKFWDLASILLIPVSGGQQICNFVHYPWYI